jgi:NNP family nitrate/nitrite transporter-like MFS transporter
MAAGLVLVGIGSGIYPPSGNASITAVVKPEKRGLALAVHEMGPNLGFFAVPLIALALHGLLTWRGILLVIVCVNLSVALIYARYGFGAQACGHTPRFDRIKVLVKLPEVWFFFILECVALGALQGVFTILPMFLVTVRNLDPDLVNKLTSFSRISCILMLLVSGSLVNAIGVRAVILAAFIVSGIATIFMGITTGTALVVSVIIQPALMAAFFPAALMILSDIGPPESQNVTFSLVVSFAVFVGNGVVPIFFGWLGDLGIQSAGFVCLAVIILMCAFFIYRNRAFGAGTRK